MGLPQRDAMYHTYRDYLTWTENARYELIDGAAYLMAPAPARAHQESVLEMARQVANALQGKPCRPFIAPFDVRLPKSNEADASVDTVVQPDLLVVCDASKLDERGMRGAPDWVVEVLSPSSASHDQTIKLAAYERAGVPEVWLVHPIDHVITVFRLEGTRYGRPGIFETKGTLAVTTVSDIVIDWDLVFPPATDGAPGDDRLSDAHG
jgi:Uma2 family endonuclease